MRVHEDGISSTTVAADGTATAAVGIPTRPPLRAWNVEHISVSTTTGRTDTAKAYIYRGSVDDANFICASDRGGADSTTGDRPFFPGESVVCRWVGATAGDTATLRVEATAQDMSEYQRGN